jgi:hypothetical protein
VYRTHDDEPTPWLRPPGTSGKLSTQMTVARTTPGRRRRRHALTILLAVGAALTGLGAAGCSNDAGDARLADAARDAGPVHVHGLGVNPADGSLVIATHTGLFRMGRGSDEAVRIGDRYQDTMGFTVIGPDRFLGSGHPDLRDDLPPLLGLIESTDAGRSWEPLSLLGEADFHALHASGSRITAYDASGSRVMLSDDGGRTWRARPAPAALGDLVADPRDPDHLIAASEAGLLQTRDAGLGWRRVGPPAVLLAWPRADALYALAAEGTVSRSGDGGRSWSPAGAVPGEVAAVTAPDAGTLIVALHDGGFASSRDGGRTWRPGAWS